MSTSQFPQHERLTRVLNIYRSAMRRHIAEQWRGKHGDEWFHEMFSYLTEHQQQEITNTRETLDRQRVERERVMSNEEQNEFLLDISMFMEATKSRSDLFGREMTAQDTIDKFSAVYQIRNKWAHPPLRDLNRAEVNGTAEDCASILDLFDKAAAEAVREAAREEDGMAAMLERMNEHLDDLQRVVETRGMPSEQLSGMLGQLLESTSRLVERDQSKDNATDFATEVRALRAEIAASRTRLGDWWGRCEREILVWWDRLMGRR